MLHAPDPAILPPMQRQLMLNVHDSKVVPNTQQPLFIQKEVSASKSKLDPNMNKSQKRPLERSKHKSVSYHHMSVGPGSRTKLCP
jgi:hypothetical protein